MMTKNRDSWSDVGQRVAAELANQPATQPPIQQDSEQTDKAASETASEEVNEVAAAAVTSETGEQVDDLTDVVEEEADSRWKLVSRPPGSERDSGRVATAPAAQGAPRVPARASMSAGLRPALWVLGAHGGAGTTTVASLGHDWADGERSWPFDLGHHAGEHADQDVVSSVYPTVMVARTHASGLLAARSALTEHTTGQPHAPDVDMDEGDRVTALAEVIGLVLVADAPGKPPRPLRDLITHVSGAAPQVWHLGWIPELRFGAPEADQLPKPLQRLAADLRSALNTFDSSRPTHPATHQQHHLGRNPS